jgi:PTS system fructose-specific IIC component
LTDKELYLDSVLQREEHSATGIERGLAIPHGKSKAVKKAGFAVMTLAAPLSGDSWVSLSPDNRVELIVLLAIPETEAGDIHLKLLGEFSKRLMDKNFTSQLKQAENPGRLYSLLDQDGGTGEETPGETSLNARNFVLAITSCAAGIAHTYMAAEALNKAAGEMGIGM